MLFTQPPTATASSYFWMSVYSDDVCTHGKQLVEGLKMYDTNIKNICNDKFWQDQKVCTKQGTLNLLTYVYKVTFFLQQLISECSSLAGCMFVCSWTSMAIDQVLPLPLPVFLLAALATFSLSSRGKHSHRFASGSVGHWHCWNLLRCNFSHICTCDEDLQFWRFKMANRTKEELLSRNIKPIMYRLICIL